MSQDKSDYCGLCAPSPKWSMSKYPKVSKKGDETIVQVAPHTFQIHRKDGSCLEYFPGKYSPRYWGANSENKPSIP